jgi:chromosome segregation ATPase
MANNAQGSGVPMTDNTDIVFEKNSGISQEEQQEILAGINGIAEKNRRSLSGAAQGGIAARKKGGLFPALVNAAAVLFLVGGFFLLSSFHGKEDVLVRQGTKVYNSAERALIDEIRKETSFQIEEKENEISLIVSKMEEVDAQLHGLHSANRELTADQRAAEENLRRLQDEYRAGLSTLQDERSRILENSRAREASLNAQLEARNREFAAAARQSEAALDAAQRELAQLSREQETAANIEAQLGAYFSSVNGSIQKGQLDNAASTLASMRQFLNTPAFQSLRSIQARKALYAQSIDSLEALIQELRKAAPTEGVLAAHEQEAEAQKALRELQSKNAQLAQLEEENRRLNSNIASGNSREAGSAQQLLDIETQNANLRSEKSTLETRLQEKNQDIAAKDSEIRELQTENAANKGEITTLGNQLNALRQALQALSQ